MQWIWQHPDWPEFRYSKKALAELESRFLHKAGMLYGAMRHVAEDDSQALTIQLMSEEALKTSEIEGEILDRESVQSSIQRQFGLKTSATKKSSLAEQGISEMMVDVYHGYAEKLSHGTLFRWHGMLTNGRRDLRDVGQYRTHDEAMQIISNRLDTPKIHYEAPHSKTIKREMTAFLNWFNKGAGESALVRSGLAHLYFESIHPFEDGNGRIGRAILEKALSQGLGRPTLIALSQVIQANKKEYYAALQRNSSGGLDVTDWLLYFGETVLKAQDQTQAMIDFMIAKTKFYNRFAYAFNERQQKVIARMFKKGHQGFEGGLSADKYIRLTGAPRATVTRDLQDLVAKGALTKTGQLRHTRYFLNLA
jgi:Fic family protein